MTERTNGIILYAPPEQTVKGGESTPSITRKALIALTIFYIDSGLSAHIALPLMFIVSYYVLGPCFA